MALADLTQNLTATVPPIPVAPSGQDFYQCNKGYGTTISFQGAQQLSSTLPQGDTPIAYSIHSTRDPSHLPFTLSDGKITLFAELSPSVSISMLPSYTIAPDTIRGMAGWLLDTCVKENGGNGGFVTKGFDRLVDYIQDPDANIDVVPLPPRTVYLTLSMMGEEGRKVVMPPSPGDFDFEATTRLVLRVLENVERVAGGGESEEVLMRRAMRLTRVNKDVVEQLVQREGERVPWWGFLKRYPPENPGVIGGVGGGGDALGDVTTF